LDKWKKEAETAVRVADMPSVLCSEALQFGGI
jgi:hypothetical protein